MHEICSRRCRKSPIYGQDLISVVIKLINHPVQSYRYVCMWLQIYSSIHRNIDFYSTLSFPHYWLWSGYAACKDHQSNNTSTADTPTFFSEVLPSLEHKIERLEDTLKRYAHEIMQLFFFYL